jgi:hypothetical protein
MFSKKKMTPAAVGVVAIAAALLVSGGAPAVAQNNGTTAIVHFYDVTPALTTDATVTAWGTFNTLSGSSESADTAITCPSASTGAFAFISLASRANSATTPATWEGWKFIRTLTTNKSLSNINVSPSTFANGTNNVLPKSGGNYYLGIACTSAHGETVDAAYYRSITTVSPNGAYSTTDNPSGITAAPSNLAATTATLTSVRLTWSAPSVLNGGVITDYVVQYRLNSGVEWSNFVDAESSTTGATVTGLSAGRSYQFQVAARTSGGLSSYSSSATKSTLTGITSAPRSLATSTTTRNSVRLTWSAPQTLNGGVVTDYKVQYRLSTSRTWLTFTDPVSATTGATVTGLTPNKTYQFQVSAKTAQGFSVYTATVSKLTLRSK